MIENQWYIACFLKDFEKNKLQQKKIVGKDLVIFQNKQGHIGILENRCCHRNVQLSLGALTDHNIKCGYHGWEYDTNGKCVHIPMLENNQDIPNKACIHKYTHQIKHQIVWVYIGDASKQHLAEIPDFSALDKLPFVYNHHILEANLTLVAESLFDAQHINHVHKNSIKTLLGKLREPKTDFTIEIQENKLKGKYKRINNSSFFEKIYFGFEEYINTRFAFWYPHSSMLASSYPKHAHFPSRDLIIFEHFYEIEPNLVYMIQITAWRNIFRFNPWFASWFMKRKSDAIVAEDIVFLESNYRWHQEADLQDLIIKNDEPTVSFKKLWRSQSQA